MAAGKVEISFVPALDEADAKDPVVQGDLQRIVSDLEVGGFYPQPIVGFQKSGTGMQWLTGDVLMAVEHILEGMAGALLPVIGIWLKGHMGRTVTIKVDGTTVKARNIDEAERGLKAAADFKSQTKAGKGGGNPKDADKKEGK